MSKNSILICLSDRNGNDEWFEVDLSNDYEAAFAGRLLEKADKSANDANARLSVSWHEEEPEGDRSIYCLAGHSECEWVDEPEQWGFDIPSEAVDSLAAKAREYFA